MDRFPFLPSNNLAQSFVEACRIWTSFRAVCDEPLFLSLIWHSWPLPRHSTKGVNPCSAFEVHPRPVYLRPHGGGVGHRRPQLRQGSGSRRGLAALFRRHMGISGEQQANRKTFKPGSWDLLVPQRGRGGSPSSNPVKLVHKKNRYLLN